MSIAEFEPPTSNRITYPDGASPDMLVDNVTIPEKEMMQAYLVVRFGETILELCEADQAELYQMDVSGATEQEPELPPLEPDWSVLGEIYVERALNQYPRVPHQPRRQKRRPHERY
ncbi:MAG: hypothetical protein ACHQT5_00595 [Candidatus Saccharimonadales bacterium]|jgi:hypothetical protein